jgi:hypothetical protein
MERETMDEVLDMDGMEIQQLTPLVIEVHKE